MSSTFPCATCGAPLNGSSFEYQKHMTKCHWSGKNNSFPLPSIFTTSAASSVQNTPSTTTHVINWLDAIPTSTFADFAPAIPLAACIWPSLHPCTPTAHHYSPLYTNAAWVQAKSDTSADPFCSSAPKNTWPPRPLTSSPDSEVSPCERAFAAKSSPPAPPTKKRKRSAEDCGLERPAQRLRLDTSPTGVTPYSGKRVYFRPVRPSAS